MATRTAGGGLELTPAETRRLLEACEQIARLLEELVRADRVDPDQVADETERRRQSKAYAAHVRWHVKRPHRSRSCQFCP